VLLLATGCASQQDLAMQQAVDEARDRNAIVGAAVFLLLTLAIRHVAFARAAERAARAAARGLRPPGPPAAARRAPAAWLVAAAVATELLCDLVLFLGGAIVGWTVGPTPYGDQTIENSLLFVLVMLLVLPTAAALVALAMVVQGVAARLPYVGTGTLVFLGVPHALLVVWAGSGLFSDAPDRWGALLPAALGLIGAGGFWYEAYARRRAVR
jgi:hypothetical protein